MVIITITQISFRDGKSIREISGGGEYGFMMRWVASLEGRFVDVETVGG